MPYSKEATKFNRTRSHYGDGWLTCACDVCGDEFASNQSYAKYCSQRCANDAAIAKRKQKVTAKKALSTKCVVCGQPIEQDNWTKVRKYCSTACKQRAYRTRKAGLPLSSNAEAEILAEQERAKLEQASRREAAARYRRMAMRS